VDSFLLEEGVSGSGSEAGTGEPEPGFCTFIFLVDVFASVNLTGYPGKTARVNLDQDERRPDKPVTVTKIIGQVCW
jgi:hypothetical protein